MKLDAIMAVYLGSNGDVTSEFYKKLSALGPAGEVAVNLFRACKTSERAKNYRGRYRGAGYDRKQYSIDNLARILEEHGEHLELQWGWKIDTLAQHAHPWVLYVDVPTGQVSFHTNHRSEGPDYPGDWDRAIGTAPSRICAWCVELFGKGIQ